MPERPPNHDILKPYGLEAPEGAQVNYHIGYIKNAQGEIEYTRPLPSVRVPEQTVEPYPQAVAANIRPSKRKPIKRDYKLLYAFSDAQIDYRRLPDGTLLPVHDERALEVGALLCRDLQPDLIINLGDTVDHAAISRFDPKSDHFFRTLGISYQRVHDYYAQLRADNPRARIIEVDSNHNIRLPKHVLKHFPSMYGVKRAGSDEEEYPVMTYPYLANLRAVGVEWIGGYGAAEFVYGEEYGTPPIAFRHGSENSSNGTTASKIMKNYPETHNVHGHDHTMQMASKTTRAGHYLVSMVVGASCRTTGEVEGFHSSIDDRGNVVKRQENWQNGILLIEDYGGHYIFRPIPIIDGRIFYNGRIYGASDG